jgi:hypothetical protein
MPDNQDKDGENIVLDLVDDAVISDPYPVARPAFEFLIAMRPGIGRRATYTNSIQ